MRPSRPADDAVVLGALRSDRAGGRALEPTTPEQLPVRRATIRAAYRDAAVVDVEPIQRGIQPRRGELEEMAARLGGGLAHRRAALLHGLAAHGEQLVQAVRRVGGRHAHAREADVQLLGADARDRRLQPLSELDLAREQGDGVRGIDADPRVEVGMACQAGGKLAHGCIARAARRTARRMRACVPQRQRWMASASPISSSVGCGFRSSSAFAPMIMPGMQ